MMSSMDDHRASEDELVVRWGGDDGDGIGCLTVIARSNGFGGSGQAWFDREAVLEFAAALERFPLTEDDPPTLSGGYGAHAEYDEYVGLVVAPLGARGQVDVRLHLVDDTWSHGRAEGRYETHMHLLTTYQRVGEFAGVLLGVVRGGLAEAVLEGERLA